MNALSGQQAALLSTAIAHLEEEDFSPYLELKCLLAEQPNGFQTDFRRIFERFYGLNSGGLTQDFKNRYFDLLFGLKLQENSDPYTPILKELYDFPRRQGDKALQCSFVSKLVAIHNETYPIFDRHVSNFFGVTIPSNGDVDFRIAGFVANLKWLRETYHSWSEDSQFQRILSTVRRKHSSLKTCAGPVWPTFLSGLWVARSGAAADQPGVFVPPTM